MKKLLLLSTLLVAGGDDRKGYVVHEWGTFTSVSGADGVHLDWRPLAAKDDLPPFVYRYGSGLGRLRGGKGLEVSRVRMETPVLYFYSDQELEVSAKVGFPKGLITEWYPFACEAGKLINWGKFKVVPGLKDPLPRTPGESHYYPARETDAAPLRVWTRGAPKEPEFQVEKFLFYRGVGTFDLPLAATMEGTRVTVRRTGPHEVPQAVLFENLKGRVGWKTLGRISGPATAERPVLDRNVADLHRELEAMLVREGLYEKEAAAMVKTWKDSWFEEGVRVFYLVPTRLTDEVLPLTLDPKPAELVRVLVGRAELITPEEESRIASIARRLPEASAKAELAAKGRFAEAALKRVAAGDPALRPRIEAYFRETSTAVIRP
jgi:hypothetical protein